MTTIENKNNLFQESCGNGVHIFQFIDDTSKCSNCGITYIVYQETKEKMNSI